MVVMKAGIGCKQHQKVMDNVAGFNRTENCTMKSASVAQYGIES